MLRAGEFRWNSVTQLSFVPLLQSSNWKFCFALLETLQPKNDWKKGLQLFGVKIVYRSECHYPGKRN